MHQGPSWHSSSQPGDTSVPMVRRRILLASDHAEEGAIWGYALRQIGVDVNLVGSATSALDRWSQDAFDLIVIDVCGRDLDGVELARQLRAEAVSPILLFTTRREETHILQAYQAGVDECIVKPVSPSLFLAKVRAWMRRTWTVPAVALGSLQVGPLLLDPTRREVAIESGEATKLTVLEFRLLHLLMSHRGQVLPSDLILDRVWGYEGGGDSVLLKNVVYRLRRKIEPDPSQPRYIQTVPGEGYVCSV